MIRTFPRLFASVLGAGLLLGAGHALAHAHLTQAVPAANATVAAPRQIVLTFSEQLEPKFSAGELMSADGKMLAVTSTVGGKEGAAITVVPKAPLSAGTYMVMWHVVSDDGHKMKGDYNFTVQ